MSDLADEILAAKTTYTLYELNNLIKAEIGYAFPAAYWVVAEIAEVKSNQRGHCYLELVEKKNDKTIAQVKATSTRRAPTVSKYLPVTEFQ